MSARKGGSVRCMVAIPPRCLASSVTARAPASCSRRRRGAARAAPDPPCSARLVPACTIVPRSRMTAWSVTPRIFCACCSTMMADRPSSRTIRVSAAQQLLDDDRRQALGRLVEQQQLRVEHQRAGDRQHLLLAARELVAEVGAALGEAREHLVDPRDGPRPRPRDGGQVLLDGQRLEDVALLRHPADAGRGARCSGRRAR